MIARHARDLTPLTPRQTQALSHSDAHGYTSSLPLLLSCFLCRRNLWVVCFSMLAENDVYRRQTSLLVVINLADTAHLQIQNLHSARPSVSSQVVR